MKLKLSVVLTEHHIMKTWENWGNIPLIVTSTTKCHWQVVSTLAPLLHILKVLFVADTKTKEHRCKKKNVGSLDKHRPHHWFWMLLCPHSNQCLEASGESDLHSTQQHWWCTERENMVTWSWPTSKYLIHLWNRSKYFTENVSNFKLFWNALIPNYVSKDIAECPSSVDSHCNFLLDISLHDILGILYLLINASFLRQWSWVQNCRIQQGQAMTTASRIPWSGGSKMWHQQLMCYVLQSGHLYTLCWALLLCECGGLPARRS